MPASPCLPGANSSRVATYALASLIFSICVHEIQIAGRPTVQQHRLVDPRSVCGITKKHVASHHNKHVASHHNKHVASHHNKHVASHHNNHVTVSLTSHHNTHVASHHNKHVASHHKKYSRSDSSESDVAGGGLGAKKRLNSEPGEMAAKKLSNGVDCSACTGPLIPRM